jgi:hypothetical protein
MCTAAGVVVFGMFGAESSGGLIVVSVLYGFFSGAYVSLLAPALVVHSAGLHEFGLRLGMGMPIQSFADLTGTPITGSLLDAYGFYTPIVFSGVTVLTGAGCLLVAMMMQRKLKSTWKV